MALTFVVSSVAAHKERDSRGGSDELFQCVHNRNEDINVEAGLALVVTEHAGCRLCWRRLQAWPGTAGVHPS